MSPEIQIGINMMNFLKCAIKNIFFGYICFFLLCGCGKSWEDTSKIKNVKYILPGCLEAKKGSQYDMVIHLPNEVIHKKTGIEMILILPGKFIMGNPHDERMRYGKVELTRPFYIGKYEVTVAQFNKFIEDTGYKTLFEREGMEEFDTLKKTWKRKSDKSWKNPGFHQGDDHPVVYLSWSDGKAFCDWAGLTLPTDAQWEYACRAGTKTDFYTGNKISNNDANLKGAGGRDIWEFTSPVDSFPPNSWGIYDMLGNASEWCRDFYLPEPFNKNAIDPIGPKETGRHSLRRSNFSTEPNDKVLGAAYAHHGYGDSWVLIDMEDGFRVFLDL